MTPERLVERLEYNRKYYAEHPEYRAKRRERYKKWVSENREKRREIDARYRDSHHRIRNQRASRLKSRYGLTVDQYNVMLTRQSGGCAICGAAPTRGNLSVDHCYTTGRIRGLLCKPCNSLLGRIQDSPIKLYRAARYLEAE